ncbi:MAG: hypothetical protein JST94_11900 [Bacteroidetes bacterium]|nr:hypothetical protein [Bacteroidota bacterium]MBS1672129.1 hypothetical protein [Bacteroidota bacterium]
MQFPKEQIELVQAGHEMRIAQQKYFCQRDKYTLRVAKEKERLFDRLLQLQIKAGVIKTEPKTITEQADLFLKT